MTGLYLVPPSFSETDRRRLAAGMAEKDLQEHIRKMCASLSLFHYHPLNSVGSEKGWPDSVIIGPAGIRFRELKSQFGKVTREQNDVGCKLKAIGLSWKIWRPSDLLDGTIGKELAEISGVQGELFDA